MRVVLFALMLSCLTASSSAAARPALPWWRDAHPWTTRTALVKVGEIELVSEVADTPALQQRGLGYRDGLEPGTAMLFVFPDQSVRTFWMKGMRFCLDIVWISDGVIQGAAQNVCPMPDTPTSDLPRYSSGTPVDFVLEVPAGWLEINDFGPGTPVEITLPPEPAD